MGGCCSCARSMRAWASLGPWPVAFTMRVIRSLSNIPCANWSPSVCWAWLQGTRISMIIIFCASIRSFAVAVGKEDPLGSGRAPQDQGRALASAPTLNRLELGNNKNTRCHKISADHEAIEDTLLLMGVRCLPKDSLEVGIHLDPTDDPLHGHQEGRFFPGFYGCYCYLPLFAFVGSVPLWAQLRTSDGDAARGAVDALKKIVAAVRKRCPKARIIVRADSGFCREEIMAWCETQQPVVHYCLGLARNSRLVEVIEEKFARVRESAILCGGVARGFTPVPISDP